LSFPLGDLGLDEVSSASAKKGPGRGDPGLGSLNFGGDVRRGGRTVERKIKSGVEEGGGEPSSGNTPDKKLRWAFHQAEPSWLVLPYTPPGIIDGLQSLFHCSDYTVTQTHFKRKNRKIF
jgi:hypothetical protein